MTPIGHVIDRITYLLGSHVLFYGYLINIYATSDHNLIFQEKSSALSPNYFCGVSKTLCFYPRDSYYLRGIIHGHNTLIIVVNSKFLKFWLINR